MAEATAAANSPCLLACPALSVTLAFPQEKFGELVSGAGVYDGVRTENWTRQTLPSWRHSVSVGIFDPWIVLWKGLTR